MNGLLTHMALLTLSMSFIILLVLLFIKTFGNRFSVKNFDYPEKPLKYKHIRRISD